MANICDNTLYFQSDDNDNTQYVKDYFEKWTYEGGAVIDDIDTGEFEVYFQSRWAFPLDEMDDMVKDLPNKDDIYMRCLSVEYGCYYHDMLVYDGSEKGWISV